MPDGLWEGQGKDCSSERRHRWWSRAAALPCSPSHTGIHEEGGEAAAAAGCQDTPCFPPFLPPSGTQACMKVNANQLLWAHFLQREGEGGLSLWAPDSVRMLILFLHFMSLKEGIHFFGIIWPPGESFVQIHFTDKFCPGRGTLLKWNRDD